MQDIALCVQNTVSEFKAAPHNNLDSSKSQDEINSIQFYQLTRRKEQTSHQIRLDSIMEERSGFLVLPLKFAVLKFPIQRPQYFDVYSLLRRRNGVCVPIQQSIDIGPLRQSKCGLSFCGGQNEFLRCVVCIR